MTRERAIDLCQAIDQYLCAGNPIWDVKQIHDAMSKAIEALKAQKWIPCSEELPKLGQKVLASTKKTVFTQVFKGVWNGKDKDWIWEKNTAKAIVAWMPLPEPYTGERGD